MRIDAQLTRTYSLPHSCTFCFEGEQSFRAEWCPRMPTIRAARARRKFLEAYRDVRRAFLEELVTHIGGNVLVVDTDRSMTCETFLAPARH